MDIETFEKRFFDLDNKIESLAIQIAKGFELSNNYFKEIENKLESIDSKVNHVDGKSQSSLVDIKTEMKEGFNQVLEELKKISSVTKYEEEYKNLLPKQVGEA